MIDEDKASVLRHVASLRLDMKGYMAIAQALNALGLPSPGGDVWTKEMALTYLTGDNLERLAGIAVYNLKSDPRHIESAYPTIVEADVVERIKAINERLREDTPVS